MSLCIISYVESCTSFIPYIEQYSFDLNNEYHYCFAQQSVMVIFVSNPTTISFTEQLLCWHS